jgi:AraC family transcriptional regulator
MVDTCRVTVRDGMELTWVETPPGVPRTPLEPVLALGQLAPFRVIQRRTRGSVRHDGLRHDDVLLIPTAERVVCGETGAYMGLTVEPRVLAATADAMGIAVPSVELRYRLGVPDRTLGFLIPALVREQESKSPGGAQVTEALATQLVVHLVRSNATPAPVTSARPPVTAARMARAIEFIHEHLDEPFTVADVARVMDLSPFHFSRAFKRAVGEAPHQYVLNQRLEQAHRLIAGSDLSIADVAIQTGFYDQSHFGFHFKRHFGVTPGTLRRGKDLPAR